ncbi:MAG: type IV secretion system protein VirB8 [Rickettsiales bacterium]|jgi:type IV secretion system protein VirB8
MKQPINKKKSNLKNDQNSENATSAKKIVSGKNEQKFKIKSWYSNRYQIVVVQRNILFFLTALLTISMTTSIIFVKFVVSSKSLDPYVIEIEEKSGVPTVVNQLTSETLTADESVKKYFIHLFIQAAAAYNPRTYRLDAEKVRLLSIQNIYSNFKNRIDYRRLGVDSRIKLRVKTMEFLGSSNIKIRVARDFFSKEDGSSTKNEIINMSFNFTDLKLSAEERLINPLGFQVNSFSISEEYDY